MKTGINEAILLLVANGYTVSRSGKHAAPSPNDGAAPMQDGKQAYTVLDFCRAFNISRTHFYELVKNGTAPVTFKVGRRTLISKEAAEIWRRTAERT